MLDFREALTRLFEGKRLSRMAWSKIDSIVFTPANQSGSPDFVAYAHGVDLVGWLLTTEDIVAEDWFEVVN